MCGNLEIGLGMGGWEAGYMVAEVCDGGVDLVVWGRTALLVGAEIKT